ncbi:hypothetical protein [Pleomorphomonas carboxyditropha]|uniref:Uncharacterized protein n=1 Tax=Pleomorphomonas carboxyditropha TaxID=2023338 RepID=A0A2G9X213_9HYPH|nr:hypothetical protein [Pleomorphomonas carboxyditropha]PIP01007.1 hypothetical protein CJ014_02645 [Pleomorphomonas carboxyditropha]
MLAEALLFAVARLTSPRSRAAVIRDAVGLWARARRCRAAWAEHEARTRAAIDRAIDGVAVRRTAVVLGSGLLRDVPIDRLSSMFDKVVLVDIVHLPTVRLKVLLRRYPNVSFMTRDISGYDRLAEQSWIKLATGQDDLGVRLDPLGFLRKIDELDLVISANVLSQVAVGARKRLEEKDRKAKDRKARFMPEDTVAQLVAGHLDGLAQLPCKTVIVTDVSYVRRRRDGTIVDTGDLLYGVTPPFPFDTWDWPVAPFGEEAADEERVHRVIAAEDVAVDL